MIGSRPDSPTRVFVGLLVAYALFHVGLRVVLSPTLTIDDSREAILAQTLQWGYQARQPPLYNWLVWGAFQVFGVGLLGLTLVKYALVFLTYLLVYLSGRWILKDGRLAILAAFSLLLMFPLSVNVHDALTHSVAVLAACAATFYALLRLEASGTLPAYLALGVTLGLGLLSKFSYPAFALPLLLAALTVAGFRSRLLDRRMWLALGVAAALFLPYVLWFTRHRFSFTAMSAAELKAGIDKTYVRDVTGGLFHVLKVAVYFLAPLAAVVLALCPRVYRLRGVAPGTTPSHGRLLERFLLIEVILLLIAPLSTVVGYVKFRWLIPAFFLVPLYVFWRLERVSIGAYAGEARPVRWFGILLVVTEVAIVVGLVVSVLAGSRLGRPARLNEPYPAVAEALAAAGFREGTIVGGIGPVAGTLRLRFPESRVVSLNHPDYVPRRSGAGQCLIVWEDRREEAMPGDLRAWLASTLDADVDAAGRSTLLEIPYRFAPTHLLRIRYRLLDPGPGRCR